MDYTVHGIIQARILEWVTFPSPGCLPNLGIEPMSLTLQADSLPAELKGKPRIIHTDVLFVRMIVGTKILLQNDCDLHLYYQSYC